MFRNIHDTIPPRFRLHATESLGPLVIMRRVDVHKEQAVRIAGRHEFRPDLLDAQFLDDKRGLQCPRLDPAAQDARRRPPPTSRRAARSRARLRGITSSAADGAGQPLEQRQREERQVAADDQRARRAATSAAPCRCRRADRRRQSRRARSTPTRRDPGTRRSSGRHDEDRVGHLPQQRAADDR